MTTLSGKRMLVPVTAGRRELAQRLAAQGVTVNEVVFIEVIEPAFPGILRDATIAWCVGEYEWMAVTSRNAVLAMNRIAHDEGLDLSAPQPQSRVATVGEATRGVCAAVGLAVDLVPTSSHDARGIVAEFPEGDGSVLVPVGDLASPVLARGLSRKGWQVESVEAYRVVDGPGVTPEIAASLAAGEIDAVLLTSGSVAERYAPFAAPADAGTLIVAIGRTTAAAAKAAGLTVDAVAELPSYDGILAALDSAWGTEQA